MLLDRSSWLFLSLKSHQYVRTKALLCSLWRDGVPGLRKRTAAKVFFAIGATVQMQTSCDENLVTNIVPKIDNPCNEWPPNNTSFNVALSLSRSREQLSRGATEGDTFQQFDGQIACPKESLRRKRISSANKGKVPWNKGRKHSEETKKRIRERTKQAMRNPEIRGKIKSLRLKHPILSPDIKLKIKTTLANKWKERKRNVLIQEALVTEWKEAVAEAARQGQEGDIVYKWNSYATTVHHLRASSRRTRTVTGGIKSLSPTHKARISQAIKSKWADPHYREVVEKGMRVFQLNRPRREAPTGEMRSRDTSDVEMSADRESVHEIFVDTKMKRETVLAISSVKITPKTQKMHATFSRQTKAGNEVKEMRSRKETALKTEAQTWPSFGTLVVNSSMPLVKTSKELPAFKDPQSQKKLDKLMQIRAMRVSTEERRRKELTERARILIANAKIAEKVLEAAALKDKKALGDLLETRRLLAQATLSFETAGLRGIELEQRRSS